MASKRKERRALGMHVRFEDEVQPWKGIGLNASRQEEELYAELPSDTEEEEVQLNELERFLRSEPSGDPQTFMLQFRHAWKTSDAELMEKILRRESELMRDEANEEFEIFPEDKAKVLALAMLSGNTDMYSAVIKFSSVEDADIWFDRSHPHSRCSCDSHVGSLLIRLVRGGNVDMVQAALEGGLDPDSEICDGATRRMIWKEPESYDFVREPAKLEALFEKSTPLTSAAVNDDVRMLNILVGHGADPSKNDFAAFGVAARHGNLPYLQRLMNIYSARIVPEDTASLNDFQQACIRSLKEASAAGQESIVEWILSRLEQTFDWDSAEQEPQSGTKPSAAVFRRKPSLLRLVRKHSTVTTPPKRESNASRSSRSRSREVVCKILDTALEELVQEGAEPGANMRYAIAQGIAKITELQKIHFSEFQPQRLLRFYMEAASDSHVSTGEDVVSKLLECGLGDYLMGKEEKNTGEIGTDSENNSARIGSFSSLGPRRKSVSSDALNGSVVRPPSLERNQLSPAQQGSESGTMTRKFSAVSRFLSNLFSSNGLPSSSRDSVSSGDSQSTSDSSSQPIASEEERHSALFQAVQRGHKIILKLLMSLINEPLMEVLLVEAAKHHQKEIVIFLLDELKVRALERRVGEEYIDLSDNEVELDQLVLNNVFVAALCVGDTEICDILLERGARPKSAELEEVIESVLNSVNRFSHSAFSYVFEFTVVGVKFDKERISEIFNEALERDSINFKAFKDLLIFTPFTFITVDNLRALLARSSGYSRTDAWRQVADLGIKNMNLDVEDEDDLTTELSQLLKEAESMKDVHVGVLTILMHSCESDPQDDRDDADTPSRWL